ncbi:MFS transporter [Streptomyces sp. NPDC091279]|uniref:MFS transporter n=1 Tax=Streptomyces sp. NPDC091279 TaxID=3365983 RepID=UPI0037FC75FB
MRSYQALFRAPEFTPLFLHTASRSAAMTVAGPALGTLVYGATGSPFLSAVSMFTPQLAQVVGATTLLSAADRIPPRAALTLIALAYALGTAALATPGLPVGVLLAVSLTLGLVASLGGGVQWGLLHEILPKEGYLLGRSVCNMANGLMQVAGYAAGGVLVAALSPRAALLVAAVLYLLAASVARLGLSRRPPRATGRPSIGATWRANSLLWSDRSRRLTLLGLWLPNGLVVGCEALFVAYAPHAAGPLFACAAAGMLIGDVTVGRLLPRRVRRRLAVPLLVLLAAPYLLFALRPTVWVAALAVGSASIGFGASLVQQERLMALTPDELSGHALGLHSAGMLTCQGLAATLAGTVAQLTTPATAMTALALASLTVTGTLAAAAVAQRRKPAPAPNSAARPTP